MRDIYKDSYLVTEPDGTLRRKRPNDSLICDFCSEPLGESCWTYPCGEIELPLVLDPTGLPARSDDEWACCHDCYPLVQAKAWNILAVRSMEMQSQGAVSILGPKFIEELCREIIAHFERFDAARTGEPYIEHTPYSEH